MTELILSGGAAKLLEQKAVLAKERNRIFDRFFPEAVNPGSEAAFFRWLPVPKMTVSGLEAERQLLMQSVNVYCSYRFTVATPSHHFMRVAISSPGSCAELEKGCSIIRDLYRPQ